MGYFATSLYDIRIYGYKVNDKTGGLRICNEEMNVYNLWCQFQAVSLTNFFKRFVLIFSIAPMDMIFQEHDASLQSSAFRSKIEFHSMTNIDIALLSQRCAQNAPGYDLVRELVCEIRHQLLSSYLVGEFSALKDAR